VDATVTDDAGLDFDIDGCDSSGDVVWDTNDNLDSGDEVVLEMVVQLTSGADEGDTITNEACAESTSDPGGDCDTETTKVGEPATATPAPTATVGAPDKMTLSASPAAMVCDGMDYFTITADLVDSYGNPVVDGTRVRFDAFGPAVVDPIVALTVDGAASSRIWALSGVATRIPVTVSSGDMEGMIGVDCVGPPPPLTGDVNCSGSVTMVDAMLVAQKVVGLIPEFPCGSP
jgi:hypothetical protein